MPYLDIVNRQDEVVGRASLEEVMDDYHLHRAVHVILLNEDGEVALFKRSKTSKFHPGAWGLIGGHVCSGESYEQAAERELAERLGEESDLDFITKEFLEEDELGYEKFLCVFRGEANGPFDFDPEEIVDSRFLAPSSIQKVLDEEDDIEPDSCFILQNYSQSL